MITESQLLQNGYLYEANTPSFKLLVSPNDRVTFETNPLEEGWWHIKIYNEFDNLIDEIRTSSYIVANRIF